MLYWFMASIRTDLKTSNSSDDTLEEGYLFHSDNVWKDQSIEETSTIRNNTSARVGSIKSPLIHLNLPGSVPGDQNLIK